MRELGFSRIDWKDHNRQCLKLFQPRFSTWRWQRRDKHWEAGEVVRVVLKPRTKQRVVLGEARIDILITQEQPLITGEEARADGFVTSSELELYLLRERHSRKLPYGHPLNKLTLEWVLWYEPMILYQAMPYKAQAKYPAMKGGAK